MNEHAQQDRETGFSSGLTRIVAEGASLLFRRDDEALRRVVQAAVTPGAFSPAEESQSTVVSPPPLAPMSDNDRSAGERRRGERPGAASPVAELDKGVPAASAAFSSSLAARSLVASPAPPTPMSDYDVGAEEARRLLGRAPMAADTASPQSSPTHSAPHSPTNDYDRGAEGARRLLGLTPTTAGANCDAAQSVTNPNAEWDNGPLVAAMRTHELPSSGASTNRATNAGILIRS
jgi:hypothetical protein